MCRVGAGRGEALAFWLGDFHLLLPLGWRKMDCPILRDTLNTTQQPWPPGEHPPTPTPSPVGPCCLRAALLQHPGDTGEWGWGLGKGFGGAGGGGGGEDQGLCVPHGAWILALGSCSGS